VVAARAGFDAAPFAQVVRHVRGENTITPKDSETIIPAYLDALERLVAFVDRLPDA
jgi:hypothetical protein